jgi:hypothetical protein
VNMRLVHFFILAILLLGSTALVARRRVGSSILIPALGRIIETLARPCICHS